VADEVHLGAVHPQRDPLPCQLEPDADLNAGQACQADGVDRPLYFDGRAGSGREPGWSRGPGAVNRSRASSVTPSRDGSAFSLTPPTRTCRIVSSTQIRDRPAYKSGPSRPAGRRSTYANSVLAAGALACKIVGSSWA
jgi:hypothetical protein